MNSMDRKQTPKQQLAGYNLHITGENAKNEHLLCSFL